MDPERNRDKAWRRPFVERWSRTRDFVTPVGHFHAAAPELDLLRLRVLAGLCVSDDQWVL